MATKTKIIYESRHEISNNVVCATSKASDQPAHTHSLIRAFASRWNIMTTKLLTRTALSNGFGHLTPFQDDKIIVCIAY